MEPLPRVLQSIVIQGMRILNHLCRIQLDLAQALATEGINIEIIYNMINFILKYYDTFKDQSDASFDEMLHETILFIGYLGLKNETMQLKMLSGEKSVVYRLCNLPINYFKEKKLIDILIPTLIILSANKTVFEVIDMEISIDYLQKYIKSAMGHEDVMRIIPEDEREHSMGSSSIRSLSIGSTNSS